MRQHLLRLGILVLSGCVGAIVGAYQAHSVEAGRIAALQGELDRTRGELDRTRKEAAAQHAADTSIPFTEAYQELTLERLGQALLRRKWGGEKGKALYEADKAEMWHLQHPDR